LTFEAVKTDPSAAQPSPIAEFAAKNLSAENLLEKLWSAKLDAEVC